MTESDYLEKYEGLIRHIVNRKQYRSTVVGYEDLLQEGRMGALKALRSFRCGGLSLDIWVGRGIEHQVQDFHRTMTRSRTHGSGVVFTGEREADRAGGDTVQERIDVTLLLRAARDLERKVILQRYFADRTQAEVGQRVGYSVARVSQLEASGLLAMRKRVGK